MHQVAGRSRWFLCFSGCQSPSPHRHLLARHRQTDRHCQALALHCFWCHVLRSNVTSRVISHTEQVWFWMDVVILASPSSMWRFLVLLREVHKLMVQFLVIIFSNAFTQSHNFTVWSSDLKKSTKITQTDKTRSYLPFVWIHPSQQDILKASCLQRELNNQWGQPAHHQCYGLSDHLSTYLSHWI